MSESPPADPSPPAPVNDLIDQISAGSNALAGQAVDALNQVTQTATELAGDIQSAVPALAHAAAGTDAPAQAAGAGGGAEGHPLDGEAAADQVPGFLDAPAPVLVPSEIRRLLAIEVPIIVQLGVRRMTVGEVMRFSVGAILEFQKGADDELELLASNKPIGRGYAVKVGENFGIKLSSMGSVKETIRKLGVI